jgi:hypothetical protein
LYVVEKALVLLALLVQELAEGLLEPQVYVVAERVLVQAAWVVEMVECMELEPVALLVWDILAPARSGVV